MKLMVMSDTHTYYEEIQIPDVEFDAVVHCGDFSNTGAFAESKEFLEWFSKFKGHKIFIAGNHDRFTEIYSTKFRELCQEYQVHYLENSLLELDGKRFWGSPITPYFGNMAWNRSRGLEISQTWRLIPDKLDVLITHGPPKGILDSTRYGESVGCEDLLAAIKQNKPRFHLFGHVHESYGIRPMPDTTFVNAAMCLQKGMRSPIFIEI